MTIKSCMGGFCGRRERCPHYHAASEYQVPDERICEPGHDGKPRWDMVIHIQPMCEASEVAA